MRIFLGCGALVLTILLAGCGSNTPAPPPEPPKKAEAAPPPPPPPPPPAPVEAPEEKKTDEEFSNAMKRRPRPERPTPETVLSATEPEELVKQFGQAIADRKFQAFWELLPPSHQEELRGIVVDFAGKVDGAAWNQITSVAQLILFTFKRQKERMLNHPVMDQLPFDRETAAKVWEPGLTIGNALLDSQLYDIEELKTIDFPTLLSFTGPVVFDQLVAINEAYPIPNVSEYLARFPKLKDVDAKKISGDENEAVVEILIPDEDPVTVEFVKVDGKWFPKDIEAQWEGWMTQIRDLFAMVPTGTSEEEKKQIAKFKSTLTGVLFGVGILAGSDTDQKFDENIRAIYKLATGEQLPEAKEEKPAEGEAPAEAESTEPAKESAEPAAEPTEPKEEAEPASEPAEPKEEAEPASESAEPKDEAEAPAQPEAPAAPAEP